MKLDSLQNVYISELKDIYSAENQLLKALPQMAKATSNDDLREAFENHLEETKVHVQRLDELFEKLGMSPKGKKCKAMEGLIAEGKELLEEEDAEPAALDAALICAAQKVEHYEMASYGCVRTFARLLGDEEAANTLQETLDEEGAADKKLTEIAEGIVNEEAADESEEEESEEVEMSDADSEEK